MRAAIIFAVVCEMFIPMVHADELSKSINHTSTKYSALCKDLGKRLTTKVGLVPFALESIVDDRGIERIPNVDIDGDDISDEVRWSCPNTGSSMPADPCVMKIKLSSSGKNIEFESLRFFLIRYHEFVFIVSSVDSQPQEDVRKTDIYKVKGVAAKLVCSKL